MPHLHCLDARSILAFTRFQAAQGTPTEGDYPGVLIIEKGPAKGHYAVKDGNRVVNYDRENPDHAELQKFPIWIGDDSLDDVVRAAADSDSTKCKLDHGSTVRDIIGDYSGFRRDGDQVRADLSLMDSTPHRAYVMELFSKFADKVGNSIDFDYAYEIQGDKAIARVVKLNSVDIVDTPAATNSLFNENHDNQETTMALSKEDLEALGNIVDAKINQRFSALETSISARFDEVKEKLEDDKEKSDEKESLEEGEDKEDDKKEKKEDKEDDAGEMSAKVSKAVFAAIQKALPKVALQNLSGGKQDDNGGETYSAKFQACKAAGMSDAQAIRHIANKFPHLYNAKFGAGEGGKGSASRTTL